MDSIYENMLKSAFKPTGIQGDYSTSGYESMSRWLRPRTSSIQPIGPITPYTPPATVPPVQEPTPPIPGATGSTGGSGTTSDTQTPVDTSQQEVVDAVAQSGSTTGDPTGHGPVYGTTPWAMSFWRRPPSEIRGYFEGASGGSQYSPEDIAYMASLLRLPSIGQLRYQYG